MSKITRRTVLAGGSASILAASLPAHAMPPFKRGGHPRPAGGTTTLPSFQIVEHSGVSSLGFKRFGFPVVPGDVPAGSRLRITSGGNDVPAQFDRRASRWDSGLLYFATCCIRDVGFSANETRTYVPVVESGAFDNTSTLDFPTAIAGHDFKVLFTSMSGSTTGVNSDYTASLNAQYAAHPTTRITQREKGPISDKWIVWGMATDATTAEHAHLKVEWHVTAYKNADGSIAALEVVPEIAQDWWSVAGKEKLTYDAAFMDGATLIVSYTGVLHPYGMRWVMVRSQNDFEHGTPHWIGANRPTLLFKPNQTYWVATDLATPLKLSVPYVMPAYLNTYIPGSSFSHRADIPGEGGYTGRGIISNMDCIAFAVNTAANIRIARISAFAGLHIPAHFRSNDTRTRPGDGGVSDTANTAVVNIIWDERGPATPGSFYDFTADGLPAAAHAYSDSRNSAPFMHGFVQPLGGIVSASPWNGVFDNAHAPNFSYFMYLHSGEDYYRDATLSRAMSTIQGEFANSAGGMPALTWWNVDSLSAIYPGTPSTQWAAISVRALSGGFTRAAGWPSLLFSSLVVTPDDDVHINYAKRVVSTEGKFLKNSVDLIPASGTGIWSPYNASCSPWMDNFIALAALTAFLRTGDTNWRAAGDFISQVSLAWYTQGLIGMAASFRICGRPDGLAMWNAATNDWFPEVGFRMQGSGSISASTDRITVPANAISTGLTNGDVFVFSRDNESLISVPVPSEITLGQRYYMANVSGLSFQASTTPDLLSIVDFTSDYAGIAVGYRLQKLSSISNISGLATDGYANIACAVVNLAKRAGSPGYTQAVVDAYNAFYAGIRADTSWATWTLTT